MNSEFSSIWSSVMPISNNSPRISLHEGSTWSREVPLLLPVSSSATLPWSRGGIMECWDRCCCGCGCGTLGADEDLWPCSKLVRPPKRLCDFPFANPPLAAGPWPEPWKAVALVLLLACFSRSSIFFLNCFDSFSSTKDRPAMQSSISKEWKKVRS